MTDSTEHFRALTRDLRRTEYLAERIDLAVVDVRAALASERHPGQALRAALHYHLDGAWSAGAAERADLVSTINVQRAQVALLRKRIQELEIEAQTR